MSCYIFNFAQNSLSSRVIFSLFPYKRSSASSSASSKLTINAFDLDDEELFGMLKSFGVDVGPIVETTRSLYQKKLAALLDQEDQEEEVEELPQTNGIDQVRSKALL